MIVVHVGTLPDSARLEACYKDLKDVTVLRDPRKSEVKRVLREHPNETVMLLGHGSSQGLFNGTMDGYLVGPNDVWLLRDRTVIGIWCYAAEFADRYGLHGFFTSMFISNLEEAIMNSFYNVEEKEITRELKLFCDRIHHLVRTNTPLSEWVKYLQDRANIFEGFVRFNYEALTYLEQTKH